MNFLINTITHWDEPPRARHQLSYALSEKHTVVFVSANKTGVPLIKIKRINENLSVLLPYFPVDMRIRTKISSVNRIYQKWLFKRLKKRFPHWQVINFDFTAENVFNYFKNVIYYCNDDFSAISRRYPSFISNYHLRAEQRVISGSVFCIATSAYLKNKLSEFNRNSYEIRLGGPDIRKYSVTPSFIPYTGKEKLKVVFLGFISTASVDIMNAIVDEQGIELIVIGPAEKKSGLKTEGMIFRGVLTGNKLYHELNQAHVGIIPYNLKSGVDRTPNKLWQYFAVGKPAVVSDIEGIKAWIFPEKFLYRAKNVEDFVSNLFAAARENTEQLTRARVSESLNNTWSDRSDDFVKIFLEHTKIPEDGTTI